MSHPHVHKDDVHHNNFNVEIKIVHRFPMFAMVGYDGLERRLIGKMNNCHFLGDNDCGDNSGKGTPLSVRFFVNS